MRCVRRSRMTGNDKTEIWQRWKQGQSLSEIGRAIDRIPGAVFHVVRARGGVAPSSRSRSCHALTGREREEISRGLATGVSFRQIGVRLGRATSTVSREVGRHGGRRWYRAAVADASAWEMALRPQPCRLARHPALCSQVSDKLEADWSPQQIAGWLKLTYPKDPDMQVSHETIYLSLFVQSRGVLKQVLIRHLRRRKTMVAPSARRRPVNRAAKSSMPCRSAIVHRASRTAPYPVIGRGISWRAHPTLTLRPSSSGSHAS